MERGANDSDWQPVKDAARRIAFAEDRAVFEGYRPGGIEGMRRGTSNPIMTLPTDLRDYPDVIAQALSQLRLVGVNGPYSVVLGADAYTGLSETRDHGYPVLEHIKRLIERRNHLGSGNCRRVRPDNSGRRLRPAYRPGRLDRLFQPHRRSRHPVSAGNLHLLAAYQ